MRTRLARLRAVLVGAVAGLIAGTVTTLAPAAAEDPPPLARSAATTYRVTLAARACASYADVMANQFRGDNAESPGRPGRDSGYKPGTAVDPDVEARSGCQPLAGARFTLGAGHEKKGALSTVTGAAEPVVAAGDTPRLDAAGKPTGGPLAGAVTVTLTDDQVRLATRRQLWVQGGASGALVPGGHSFAVLRCAVDGRTGGNVQWITFPPRVRHVFCFAYYVRGTAPTGTFTLKVKTNRPVGYPQRLEFGSTLSQSGSFVFAADSAEASVVRLAGEAHRVEPKLPPGWRVAGVACTGAKTTADPASGRADVTLAPGESAACGYTVAPPAAPPGLSIRVYSEGGAAQFGVTIGQATLTATPKGDGSAVTATGADLTRLPAGTYTLTVSPPPADAASWSLAGAACNGAPATVRDWTFPATVDAAVPTECALRLVRKQGTVRLRAVTTGGVATAGFALVPAAGAEPGWGAAATTAKADAPADATGDVPASLPPGEYLVLPVPPASTVDESWRLTGLGCQPGNPAGPDAAVIRLTLAASTVDCTATYQRLPATRVRPGVTAQTRTGAVAVEVSCVDGSEGRVVLPADDTGPADLPQPLSFAEKTTCTIGLADDAPRPVAASLTVEPARGNAPLPLPATVSFDQPGIEYRLTAALTYDEGDAADPSWRAGALDLFKLLPVVLIGSGLIGVGLVLLLVLAARRRMGLD